MSKIFIGQVIWFAGDFAPQGFASCSGQLIPISQNTALFSLLGTTYGGNGQSNFALPDLRGRAALGDGQGPGLSHYDLGEVTGTPSVALNADQTPLHSHSFVAVSDIGISASAAGNVFAKAEGGSKGASSAANFYSPNPGMATTALQQQEIAQSGKGDAHNNMQPYLPIMACICVKGEFPERN